ncbi:MAG TPA: response regulator [Methanocella sp.]|jgi:two-component system chemotaxis response regulator CheY
MTESLCPDGCRVGIAIVEDEKDLVEVYKRVFARRKILVCFVAFDGREALRKFIECTPKPHVILMDHRLPGMSGIEVTEEILKLDHEAKVVFLSADIGVMDEAFRAGAVAFIKKPASLKEIVGTVEAAVAGKLPEKN